MKQTFTSLIRGTFAKWLVSGAVSALHVFVLYQVTFPSGTVIWLFPLFVSVPALTTMLLVPGSYKRWYRWAILLALCFSVYPELLPLVLTVGQGWAIYRSWFLERTVPLRSLFKLKTNSEAKPARAPRQAAKA